VTYFLDQKDVGFSTDAAAADSSNWDRRRVLAFLSALLERERYDVILTLLPTERTHGHHRAATLLALEAVSKLAPAERPLVFGVEARSKHDPAPAFGGAAPVLAFDRTTPFGYQHTLSCQIVVLAVRSRRTGRSRTARRLRGPTATYFARIALHQRGRSLTESKTA
jgi:LmbE family N-acetylglucosaminyl deacetylase